MNSINFDNVYLLFLIIPLIALLVVPYFFAIRKSNRNGHNMASIALHVVMALLIAFSAAGTSIISVITKTEVYVVADVSFSANKNLDTVDNYIRDIKKSLPASAKLGVVCFGKDYELTTDLGGKITSVKDADIDDTESNISDALGYAGGLFSDGVIKRVVLITDGRQTYGDSNGLVRTVANLQAESVHVDAIFLDDNISADAKEVQITSAEFTANTYKNHAEQVKVQFNSNFATAVNVAIYRDGVQLGMTYRREMSPGPNVYAFNLDTSEAGVFDYKIELIPDEDEIALNNTYSFTQTVADDFKVLLVAADGGDADFIGGLYGENVVIDPYIVTGEQSTVPYTVEEICKYDEVVLSNVDLCVMYESIYQTFLNSLDIAVRKFGKSLVTYGNLYVQSKPNGELNMLNDLLAVNYGEADSDKKLYTIVIDVSHSMNMASRMILARQAAKKLVNMMPESDSVCIVAFSGQPQVVQPITSLANRDKVLALIDGLTFEQGTMIAPALKTAFNTIVNRTDFSEKQVYLVTDGIPFDQTDMLNSEIVVDNMRANRIYTSVLAVGGQNHDYRASLKRLAESIGGGKYYLAENETSLNAVFLEGITKDDLDPVVTEDCWIKTELTGDAVIVGDETLGILPVDLTNAFTSGFILSSKRSLGVHNVLSVTYEKRSAATGQLIKIDYPLYSYRSCGNGKVKTYTGKLNGIERIDTATDEIARLNRNFFANIINTAVPAERVDQPFTVSTSCEGKTVKVLLSPAQLHASATASVSVKTPSGGEISGAMVRDGSGYYFNIDLPEVGKYEISYKYSYGGRDYASVTAFTLSYEPEYDAFAVYDSSVLYKMLGGNGTVSVGGIPDLSNSDVEQEIFVLNLTLPFLIAAVVLYIVDIVIRKLKWSDIVSLFTSRGSYSKKNTEGKK